MSTGNLNKVAAYSDPAIDKLLSDGIATTDPVARKAIYDQVQTKLIEAAPWIWLYVGYEYRITQPYVMDFYPLSNGANTSLKTTWINK
jgi:peptide/nickel transport system substrate-binding protein